MQFRRLKKHQTEKATKIFWVLFPFFGLWLLKKLFSVARKNSRFYTVKHPKKPGKILGLVAFSSVLFWHKKWFYLKYLAMAKDSQGLGLGTKTLAECERKARAKKHDYFVLLSSPWRTRAHRFYFKKGFKRWLWFIFLKRLR